MRWNGRIRRSALVVWALAAISVPGRAQQPPEEQRMQLREGSQLHALHMALPDLVVDGVSLDEQCNVLVTVSNRGGPIPDKEYRQAAIRVQAGHRQETYRPAGTDEGMSAVDPGKVLRAGGTLTFNTRIRLEASASVTVTSDPDGVVHEADERNNELRGITLGPPCGAPTVEGPFRVLEPQPPLVERGWCCVQGQVIETSPQVCAERAGRYSRDPETAAFQCTPVQPQPPLVERGWCCADGELFPSTLRPCAARGGRYFEDERAARRDCVREPPQAEGWCCLDGQVAPLSAERCESRGGRFSRDLRAAREACRPEAPPPERGWCCADGELYRATPEQCGQRRGRYFQDQAEARRACTRETPPAQAGWCCARGEVFAASAERCRAMQGTLFTALDEARRACPREIVPPAVQGWCCVDGQLSTSMPARCEERGGRFFEDRREAGRECRRDEPTRPQPPTYEGWCCLDGKLSRTTDQDCARGGGQLFRTEEEAFYCGQGREPEPGWCCAQGQLVAGTELACNVLHGAFFRARDEAQEACADRFHGWCCTADWQVVETRQQDCCGQGERFFRIREQAAQACVLPGLAALDMTGLPPLTATSLSSALPPVRIDDVSPRANARPSAGSTQWGKMLALAGSGKEKVIGPAVSWATSSGPSLVEHLAVRSADNDLLVFYWLPGQDWKAVNVSARTGQKIAGPAAAWTTRNGDQIVEHLAAQAVNGDLLVFYWQSSQDWKVVNVSSKTGKKVASAATAWQTPNGEQIVEHLAAQGQNGELLVFHWLPGQDWKVVDVSSKTGKKVASAPVSWQTPDGDRIVEHLAAQGQDGELLVFYWLPGQDWKVVDVSSKTGKKVASAATAWQTRDGERIVEHLAAQGQNGELLVFYWLPGQDWKVVDASATAGRKVAGAPVSWQSSNGALNVEHLAAPAPGGELVVFYWQPGQDWKSVDVSARTGLKAASAATAWTTPSGALRVEHLAAVTPGGDLAVFYWMPGQDWKSVNVSSKAAMRVLYATSHGAGVWRSDDYGATWYQLTRPQPAEGAKATGTLGAPRVIDVAVSPVDAGLVLVAVEDHQTKNAIGSGIYRSTDGGLSWKLVHQHKSSGGAAQSVTQIRLAPDDPSLVYAAVTGGIAVSTDGGSRWKDVKLGAGSIWHIAVGPKEAGGKRRVYACGAGRLWYSADGGQSWDEDHGLTLPAGSAGLCEAPSDGNGTAPPILEVEPGHPGNLLLAWKHGANGPRYFAAPEGVVLTETDGVECNTTVTLTAAHQRQLGQSSLLVACGEGSVWLGDYSKFRPGSAAPQSAVWKKLPGPPEYWGGSTPSGRAYLKVHPTASGYLLFFANRTHLHVSAGRPTAGGWHRLDGLDISETWWRAKKAKTGGFWNTLSMHVDPHAILISPDFDLSLKKPSSEIPATYAKNLVLERHVGGRLWVSNDGGIYGSADGGQTWPMVREGPHTLIPVNLAGLPGPILGQRPALYMGTGDNDDFYTSDGGEQWKDVHGGCGDCGHWFADAGQLSGVFELGAAGRKGESVFHYTSPPGLPPPYVSDASAQKAYSYPSQYVLPALNDGSGLLVQTLAGETAPAGGDLYLFQTQAQGSKVLVRAKNGLSGSSPWSAVGPHLPASGVNRVQASGGHTSTVFYVGDGASLWRSHADSKGNVDRWDPIVPGGGANVANRFFANPYDPDNVYIVDSDGVKRSDNGGTSWALDGELDARLTDGGTVKLGCSGSRCCFNDLVVDRSDPRRRFAIGVMGVFATSDGVKWRRLMDARALPSIPRTGFYDPISDPKDPALYVACDGRGVLKIHPIPQK
jgi:hypothetical protein